MRIDRYACVGARDEVLHDQSDGGGCRDSEILHQGDDLALDPDRGILAKAATLLGAGSVTACDTDPVAIEIAGKGFVGSVDAVTGGAMDLVMANISPEAITALAGDLLRVRKARGVLLASGFEAHEVEQVRAALPDVREVRHKGKWALIVA